MMSQGQSGLAQSGNESVLGIRSEMRPVLVKLNTRAVAVHAARFNPDRDDGENASSCSSGSGDDTMADPDYRPDPTDSIREWRGGESILNSIGAKRKMGAAVPWGGKGRVKLENKLIKNRLRRRATFSKRKIGIMKKAHELAMLTGTQVLLLVVSETGHVYTNATQKLQPMLTGAEGKALIQSCLDSPDPPSHYDPSTDERMSSRGFEESDLTFQVSLESESPMVGHTEAATASLLDPNGSAQSMVPTVPTVPTAPTTMWLSSGLSTVSFPITILPSGFTF